MPPTHYFLLGLLAACAVDPPEVAISVDVPNPDDATADPNVDVDAEYFTVRSDGDAYFVRAVNDKRTRCHGKYSDASSSTACYLNHLDLRSVLQFDDGEKAGFLEDVSDGRAIVRGTIQGFAVGPEIQWRFVASEAWRGPKAGSPVGTVYRAERMRDFCEAAPCLAFREAALNTPALQPIDAVDLRTAERASDDQLATAVLTLDEQAILIAGDNVDGTLAANQFYLPMTHDGLAPHAAGGEAVAGKSFVDEQRTRRYRFASEIDRAANTIAVTIEDPASGNVRRAIAQIAEQGVALSYAEDPADPNYVRALQWRTDNVGSLVLLERNGTAKSSRFREDQGSTGLGGP